ncbi:hypothetical protein [Nostoc sp. C052]|uniref:hypothetical protein n=1 Tax=Nostoc sp. C052 TaxID=2576902 RepID=UPI00211936D8|nr:hypothetical protein [Nostoc sp. C052]
MNFSEVIAQTDVEMQRLGLTTEQGRDHLIKTYGKRSRFLLTDEQLYEFLQYLVSQPTPTLEEVLIAGDITPFTPPNYSPQEDIVALTGTGRRKKKTQPVDLSDVIAKTDVEIQRLGWTPKQGREHLIKVYGKQGRTLLTEVELLDFLQYLVSLPTTESPTDFDAEYEEFQDLSTYSEESDKVITRMSSEDLSQILDKTDVQMQRLGWTTEQGREHLIKVYGKRSRTLLTEAELLDFRQYLASLTSQATPADLLDVIAKTDIEMQRLGWTPEQGREHLIKVYGKRSRTLLTEVELLDFLQYLISQPTQALDEIFIKTPSKQSRNLLTQEKLLGFLKYIESQPTVEYPSRNLLIQEKLLGFLKYVESQPTVECPTDIDAEY